MYRTVQQTELYHFGIKGMKWGIRRYQNEDGSYTEAGLARKAKQEARAEQKKRDWERNPKNFRKMSNEDLNRVKARLELESQVSRLADPKGYKRATDSASVKTLSKGIDTISTAIFQGYAEKIKKSITKDKVSAEDKELKELQTERDTLQARKEILDKKKALAEFGMKPSDAEIALARGQAKLKALTTLNASYSALNKAMGFDQQHSLTPYDEEVSELMETIDRLPVSALFKII